MWWNLLRGLCLGLGVGVWEMAVRPFLPGFLSFSLTIPLIVLTISRHRSIDSMWARVVGLMLIEWLFSFATGVESFRWLGIAGVLFLIFEHAITSQSALAVASAALVSRLVEQGLLHAFHFCLQFFVPSVQPGVYEQLLPVLVWDVALSVSVFLLITWFSSTRGTVPLQARDGWML